MTKRLWTYIIGALTLLAFLILIAFYTFPDKNLHLIACDVGQGDAILVVFGETQILFDGGPDRKVIDCLSRHVPFWDNTIEAVFLTHPEKDHYQGLIEVFKRYKVEKFISSGLVSSSQGYRVLESLVGGGQTKLINSVLGTSIGNSMMHIDIVYPTSEYIAENSQQVQGQVLGSFTSDKSPNDFSLVAILSVGEFDALLMGDLPPEVSEEVEKQLSDKPKKGIEYIKVPHHGSKNGLTRDMLKLVSPKLAVISVGKNQWGHPNKEILDILKEENVEVHRTDQEGDIEIITDGQTWYKKI